MATCEGRSGQRGRRATQLAPVAGRRWRPQTACGVWEGTATGARSSSNWIPSAPRSPLVPRAGFPSLPYRRSWRRTVNPANFEVSASGPRLNSWRRQHTSTSSRCEMASSCTLRRYHIADEVVIPLMLSCRTSSPCSVNVFGTEIIT